MEELIKQAFLHVDIIGPHVQQGHYDLIGPNGEIILPQVWETMIEPDWAITMHMWPMPEPKPQTGPPPGHHFNPHGPERPRSSHRPHGAGGRGPPPMPPPSAHRGGPAPPPPPPGFRSNMPPPGLGGQYRERHGPGGPPIMVMKPGSPPPKKKKPEAKGMLGWMAGKPAAKSSGKGMFCPESFYAYYKANDSRSKKS